MFDSVRARLTLWYTAVLAVVLIAFSGFSYLLLARAIRSATDASIAATAHEFASAFAKDRNVALGFQYSDREIFVFSANGVLVAPSRSRLNAAERARLAAELRKSKTGFVTIEGGDEDDGIRLFRQRIEALGQPYTVVVAQDLDPQADRLEAAAGAVLLGIPITLIIAAGGGYLLARKSLAPVAAMSAKARQIGAATLDERIAVQGDRDELSHLAVTLNDLLERLQRAFESQRQFMADASHELRTPIAIILGEADVSLSKPERARTEYRDSMRVMRKAALKLTRTVQNVFLLARTDAGTYPMRMTRFYLDEILAHSVRLLRTVATAKGVELHCEVEPDLLLHADEELVQHLVENLIENAVKFTHEGGHVTVTATRTGGFYDVRVRDTGDGIPTADQPLIFNRFFRGAKHVRGTGAGLGLAIAQWIAGAHGATLTLEESHAGGSTFLLRFPSIETAAAPIARAEGE